MVERPEEPRKPWRVVHDPDLGRLGHTGENPLRFTGPIVLGYIMVGVGIGAVLTTVFFLLLFKALMTWQ